MAEESAVECPQCGHINQPATKRCSNCNLDLEWARVNWEECVSGLAESHPPLILQVNDEVGALTLCEIILTRGGYRIARAYDAYEALELTEHFIPDLIITDDMMPGMRGRDMISCLKNTPALQDVPIVMLSPRTDHDTVRAVLDAGAICFHPMPIPPHTLCAIVASVLAGDTDFPKGCIWA